MVQRLAAHWESTRPDLVVSLIPNFNRALHDGLILACPGVPFVTVLTDKRMPIQVQGRGPTDTGAFLARLAERLVSPMDELVDDAEMEPSESVPAP